MNELTIVFDRMGIDTTEVIEAMNTKWNALGFRPGLVGGHCIGVDPYYFVYQAERLGYHSQIILSGRQVNDSIGAFIGDAVIKQLVLTGKPVKNSKVVIFGLTFKENCPDIRNSKVEDIINRLNEYGIEPIVVDPVANSADVKNEYNIELINIESINNADCLIFAVAHDYFKEISLSMLDKFYSDIPKDQKVLIDIKSIFDSNKANAIGYRYWRL